MKKLLLPLILLISISASAQVTMTNPPQSKEIDLRYDPKKLKKGKNQLIIGTLLSTVGAGVAILAPNIVKKPTSSPTSTSYFDEFQDMNNAINTYKGIGVAGMGIGFIVTSSGVSNIVNAIRNK